jgi:hypothetical protein
MANTFVFANNAVTTLAAPILAGATVINLAAGTGSLFPSVGAGQTLAITFQDAETGLINEIAYASSVIGDVMNVTRAQEGTTAKAWDAGDFVSNYFTAGTAASFAQGGGGGSQLYSITTPVMPTGIVSDYNPPGNVAGRTNRWIVQPVTGTILGGIPSPAIDGFSLELFNPLTLALTFEHMDPGSSLGNQILCPNGLSGAVLPPLDGLTLKWISNALGMGVGYWMFK